MATNQELVDQRNARRKGGTPSTRLPAARGVGDALSDLIGKRTGKAQCPSRCKATATKMNAWGADKCRENVDKLAEEIHGNIKNMGWTESFLTSTVKIAAAISRPFIGNKPYRDVVLEACDVIDPPAVDVLIVLNSGVDGSWTSSRGDVPVRQVEAAGFSAGWCQSEDAVERHLAKGARLIINRAFALGHTATARLSDQYPDAKFVACCHSSQSYLMLNQGKSLTQQTAFIALAKNRENCYYATVDSRNYPGRLHKRCIYLPNAVSIPKLPKKKKNEMPIISLVGRGDVIKNYPQQIIALAMLAETHEFRVALAIKSNAGPVAEMTRQWGLDVDLMPWMEWREFIEWLGGVDVGLQCSFSESFNYVGLEHMLSGVPVVGSSATRYIPQDWHADPEQPEQIAGRLRFVLDGNISQKECRELAEPIAKNCNETFAATIRTLLK